MTDTEGRAGRNQPTVGNLPVVIVGASMGGLRTAEALRRFGYAGPLTVIGEEVHAPYNRPPLSKEVLSAVVSHEAVAFPVRASTADVEWMLGSRVASADLEAHTVTTEHGAVVPFSALVIATGLRPRRAALPQLRGRHTVRTLDDAVALRDDLITGARVVVYGSGFVGCEVASTARKLGCEVTIVSPSEGPLLRQLGSMVSGEVRRRLEERGVAFRMARSLASLEGTDRLTGVVLDDGSELPADVLVEAIGSEPNTEWLAGTGLDISNGVLADSAMRAVTTDGVPREDIYVVGDVARFPNPLFDAVPRRIEHWNIPTDTGKRAAQVLAARLAGDGSFEQLAAERFAPMPAFWSIQLDIDLQAYGLPGLGSGDVRLLEGELDGDFIAGYYRDGELVGVVGQGMKAALLPYRAQIAAAA